MKKLLCSLALLINLATFSLADVPPAEKLLPADTLLVVTVPDYTKAREFYAQSPQAQLWADPAMKSFRDKFMGKLNSEVITPLERELNISLTNYTGLLQGQLTFAVTQNGWQGGKDDPMPGWLLLLDAKTNSALLKTNLADLKRKWTDANKPLKTEKIRDVEFTVLMISSNDVPQTFKKLFAGNNATNDFPVAEGSKAPAPTKELYIGQADSLLIVGDSPKSIEKILIPLSGGSLPTLSEQPAYQANRLAASHAATFFGWVNTKVLLDILAQRLTDKAVAEADQPAFTPYREQKIIPASGLAALKSVAFTVHQTPEGGFFDAFLNAPESDRQGLLKIFAGEAKETAPTPFVPADAMKFYRIRIDGQKGWATLEKMLSTIAPQLLAGLNFALEMGGMSAKEKDSTYDLKKALIGNLGDDWIGYQKAPRTKALVDVATPPSIFLIGSPQPDKLVEALKNIFSAIYRKGEPPTEREFLGRKIYSFQLPTPRRMANGEKATPRTMNFAASAGYVAISADNATLEEYLRNGEKPVKPLRETPGLAEAMQRVSGDGTSWLSYENQREAMRTSFELLKQSAGEGAGATALNPLLALGSGSKFKEWVDVSLLPDFDKVSKYFNFSVSAGSASADGLSMKLFAPTPPQLKK